MCKLRCLKLLVCQLSVFSVIDKHQSSASFDSKGTVWEGSSQCQCKNGLHSGILVSEEAALWGFVRFVVIIDVVCLYKTLLRCSESSHHVTWLALVFVLCLVLMASHSWLPTVHVASGMSCFSLVQCLILEKQCDTGTWLATATGRHYYFYVKQR